ncbi:MAG: hypothetical protein NZM16_07655 [Thermoflexus sp.]|uniref:hypothetical protein n=1 Tax=Thermoflexus sp. TaxID=1969742 RepID=UPI0025E8C754|nr:hypothetical protein [Thermoflexus sp.]MCS6963906.1 hypothetical protein [Thermoflexus sp.]MCS7350172.1 hypothetical protein [Thermoflexus sp.]MDW8179621.1 hypothetical protein [Anaerolineae bacterium]MDW8185279.1 hypothetical protein [Anaerolineae bacterium]
MVQNEDIYEAEILERCLRRLEQGADLETCLREFPEATSLLPLLKTALWLRKGQEVSLRPPALQRMIRQGQLYASRAKARLVVSSMTLRWAGALVALLGLILVALRVVSAAEASLPDEPLYPVKRAVEGLLVATMPPEERALWLAERRWEEFETATTQGRWLPALAEESLQYLEEAARSPGGESSPRRARLRALYERQGAILDQALRVAPPETRSELARAQQEWRRLTRFLGLPEGGIPLFPEETPAAFPEPTAEILRERMSPPPGLERRDTPRSERTPPGLERRETPRSERTPPGLERRETPRPQRTPPGQERQPTPRIPPGQQDDGKGPGQTPPGRR